MNKNNNIPDAEIKLGLNILKEGYEIITTDTPEIREIKKCIDEIDSALKSGDINRIYECNISITSKYKSQLLSSSYHFEVITIKRMEDHYSSYSNFITLKNMGLVLNNLLISQQIERGAVSLLKVGFEYLIDKSTNKINSSK